MLDAHDRVVERVCARHGGTVVKQTGDGALVVFDLASRAVRAAVALKEELAALGLDWLEGYAVDDHYFRPSGYSLNAVRDDDYVTVHVTPDDHGSYASLELSVDRPLDVSARMRSGSCRR